MAIDFNCAKCQKAFTVADSSAGKQGRCSDCGHFNTIPNTVAATMAPSNYEVTSSVNGAVFGPADQTTLNQWLDEGRITPDCQIKEVGSENWKPAKQFFPKLRNASGNDAAQSFQSAQSSDPPGADPFAKFKSAAEGPAGAGGSEGAASTSVNPYAASSTRKKQISVTGEVVPTKGDIGFILGHAFEAFKQQMGVMIGGFVIYFILAMGNSLIVQVLPALLGVPGLMIGMLLNMFVSAFLMAGLLNLSLKVGRGESAELGDMFSVGDRVLPMVGFAIIATILLLLPAAALGAVMGLVGQDGGVIAAIAVCIFLLVIMIFVLLFWPGYFLIADRKTGVRQAFNVGVSIGQKNILQFIGVYIIAGLVGFAGMLLLGIGLLFTGPLAVLILTCAYLNMSGQIRE